MSSIYKRLATAIVRWLLNIAATWLISKGVISQTDADSWLPEIALGIVLALASLGWSLWAKIADRVGFLTALNLPAQATPQDVKEAVAELSPTEKITKALEPVESDLK